LQDKAGALIGRELADLYGWKVGDRIPLISSIHPRADNMILPNNNGHFVKQPV
jgi:putative ABC transport system permease protein